MPHAPHLDELVRLKALCRYQTVPGTSKPHFDRLICRIAQRFEVPMAFMTLIDAFQQWFVSCYGVRLAPIDRDLSLCDATFRANKVLVVENARTDARFNQNPLVTGEPNIRFYASAPLQTPDGPVGTLCIADGIARQLSEAEIRHLSELSNVVVNDMERQRQGEIPPFREGRPRITPLTKLTWAR